MTSASRFRVVWIRESASSEGLLHPWPWGPSASSRSCNRCAVGELSSGSIVRGWPTTPSSRSLRRRALVGMASCWECRHRKALNIAWPVYHPLRQTTKLYAYDVSEALFARVVSPSFLWDDANSCESCVFFLVCTQVSPFALLLFGGEPEVNHAGSIEATSTQLRTEQRCSLWPGTWSEVLA